ncbi:hypothetical protein LCI18_007448 [Fusarium solani-melongenae]|uniref:Uncharacterized protein n=1 Tax=Fusarium solani subsp. cucurbitae TaxID=2747967 RepID=A0ACD3Z8W2_FUSSC|nr:hypothetical protein LCI18_007448 [Fusarium solani-melongenae]
MGNDRQPGRLALAHKDVNGRKTVFFQGQNPTSANEKGNADTRRMHRNTAGVFYYMRRPEIWSKFVETSQAIEEIFDDFDIEPTDRVAGQPTPGLRDLYCYWIDMTLAEMEATAAAWLTAATANFKANFGDSPDGKKWLANVLNSNGYISASKLKFPQAAVKHRSPSRANPDIWTQSNYQGLWKSALGSAGPF